MQVPMKTRSNMIGQGGVNCPCCTPAKKKETKKLITRINRRKEKQKIKQDD